MQVDGSNDGGSLSLGASRGIPTAPNATGMLIGFNGNEDIATQAFMLPVNTPMALSLYLTAEASVSVDFQESFITSANTDFSGTLTFATDVPVFSLPPGYTVNSAAGGGDCQHVCGAGGGNPGAAGRRAGGGMEEEAVRGWTLGVGVAGGG